MDDRTLCGNLRLATLKYGLKSTNALVKQSSGEFCLYVRGSKPESKDSIVTIE